MDIEQLIKNILIFVMGVMVGIILNGFYHNLK